MTFRDDIRAMLASYIETAMWSESPPDDDCSLSDLYLPESITPESRRAMRRDCIRFAVQTRGDWMGVWESPDQVGHDFWLTRNRHGAGFWDHYGNPSAERDAGERMTGIAHLFGGSHLIVGDDGNIEYFG